MKTIYSAILASFITVFILSCNPNGEKMGTSTDIDTVNVKGEAPVIYKGDDPMDTNNQLTTDGDTGRRANTVGDPEHPDSVNR